MILVSKPTRWKIDEHVEVIVRVCVIVMAAGLGAAAEAQAAGQASDSTEYACGFLESLLNPQKRLREILQGGTALKPILITDAKALYDSYHKEGCSGST